MSELVSAKSNSAAALAFESLESFLADQRKVQGILNAETIEEVEHGVAKILPAVTRNLDAALRPASQKELAAELALIVAAFPNSKANEDFGSILFASVAATRPRIGAVMMARQRLIFTSKFTPSIAEVREAIMEATEELGHFISNARRVPERLEWMKKRAQVLQADISKGWSRASEELNRLAAKWDGRPTKPPAKWDGP